MKFAFIISILLMSGVVASATTLVKDGKSDYVIVLAEKPLPANTRAANELQKYLAEMSGATLAIVDDSKHPPAHSIIVGPNRFLEADKVLGNDGFILSRSEEKVLIVGPGPRGSMYGTYELLERLGVRWFTPTVTKVPKQSTIEVPDDLNVTQIPAFEYREPYFTEAFDKDWAAHNRVVGASAHLDESTGGTIRYADFVHTFDRLIPPALYEKHPEYFPMVGGKRINGYVQRCLTNPDVLKLAIEGVKQAFKDHPEAVITSVSQNDVDKWCECDNCKALAAKYGGQSGAYIWFVNQVAEAIEKDPALKDKLIDTLAYQFTEAPPKNIAPRKNVRVRLCPINVCQGHAYEKDDFPASKAFVSNLAAWAKVTDTLYIWAYCTDFAHYLMPFPDFAEFPADIRLYRKSGVRGVFFEGAYAGGGGGSDAELRSWVMAKLLWNPDLDSNALVSEWVAGVYGKAAPPMRQWFDVLQQKASDPKQHFQCYTDIGAVGFLTPDVLKKGDELFDQAEKLAADDATAKQYVGKSRLWLRYAKIMKDPAAAADVKSFVADCRKFGIAQVSEGGTLDQWEQAHKK